jgi:oryzin
VDSGIRTSHEDFGGRAELGYNVFNDSGVDTLGHGTHVAGTVIGSKYGVAKKARAVGVKVFQSTGTSMSTILKGYDWAIDDIISKGLQNSSVINLSLGGGFSEAFHEALTDATAAGILSIVAAGNDDMDADLYSPASSPKALTVGAMDKKFSRFVLSNWGEPLDIFAPGVDVLSADISSDTAASFKTGTSMAAPHVAGMALEAISVHGITGPEAITKHILKNGLRGVVKGNLKGSVNLMANLGLEGGKCSSRY